MKSIEECLKARNVRAFELKAEDDVNKERLTFYRDAAGTCLTAVSTSLHEQRKCQFILLTLVGRPFS